MSERLISGRRVLIKDAKDFKGRPATPKDAVNFATSIKPPTNRIFVGNLGFDVTKEDVEEHFARCGEVTDVHVATFEDSGKCKGFAWVTFGETQSAATAIQGWVKLPTTEESSASEEEGEDHTAGEARSRKRGKKPVMRKSWLNRIHGKSLRMEFAEDKAVRYKKRFGKDGTARKPLPETSGNAYAEPAENGTAPDEMSHSGKVVNSKGSQQPKVSSSQRVKSRHSSMEVSRLTGGLVESQGKKTVFA